MIIKQRKDQPSKFYANTVAKKDAKEWFAGDSVYVGKLNGKMVTLIGNNNEECREIFSAKGHRYIGHFMLVDIVPVNEAVGRIYVAD